MNKLRLAVALTFSLTITAPALAAEGSIGLTAGTGTNAALTAPDGSTNVSFLHALCGGAAATMGTACANQLEINSSGQALMLSSQSGTWNIVNISGTISLPTGAATSALQTTGNTTLSSILTAIGSPIQTTGGQVVTKTGTYSSAGAGQYSISINSVTGLTIPGGTTVAEICVETAVARYTDDGVTPSATVGIPVSIGQCFAYAGPLSAFQIIGAGATLDVSYYK